MQSEDVVSEGPGGLGGKPRFRVYSPRLLRNLPMPTFYDRFVECSERWPDNVALELQRHDHIESCTYAELHRMAESVGRWITENGFPHGCAAGDSGRQSSALGRGLSGNHRVGLRRRSARHRAARRPSHQAAERQWHVGGVLRRQTCSGGAACRQRTETRPHPHGSGSHDRPLHRRSLAGQSARHFRRRPRQVQSRARERRRPRFPALHLRHHRRPQGRDADARQLSWAKSKPFSTGSISAPPTRCWACCRSFMCWRRWRICCLPLVKGSRVVYLETLNTTELLRALSERNITAFAVVPQFYYLIHERIFQEIAKRGAITQKLFAGHGCAESHAAQGRHQRRPHPFQESAQHAGTENALPRHRRIALRPSHRARISTISASTCCRPTA